MTLHKAKGLEFARVFIPRLDGAPRGDSGELLRWDEQTRADGEPVFLLAANDDSEPGEPTLYRYLGERRKLKQAYEATRLLYVGATRAIHHLHLSAGIRWDDQKGEAKKPPSSSLLATIWDTFVQEMRVRESVEPGAEPGAAAPALVRLAADHLPPFPGDVVQTLPPDNLPERPDNHFERVVGTVVHLALEELSLRTVLPANVTDGDRSRWRCALQVEGLVGEQLERGLAQVLASVTETLREGGEGRWVLSSAHREAHSEWAITCLDGEGVPGDIVIDRSFIDAATGVRWVVDYKTSRPLDAESLEAFIAREEDHYSGQLHRYRDALCAMGEEPVRCALFFTALGMLHPLHGPGDAAA
jgi:ATP-dependent exoDNAse (exonuclease V) beta subunit